MTPQPLRRTMGPNWDLATAEVVMRVFARGWRPRPTPGPTRAELAEVLRGALSPA